MQNLFTVFHTVYAHVGYHKQRGTLGAAPWDDGAATT